MKVIDFQDANCRHCYKCVRNCSVKAISVRNEQAHIIREAAFTVGIVWKFARRMRKHLRVIWSVSKGI